MGTWIRKSAMSLLVVTIVAACTSSSTAPSQNPALDLAGTWSGVVGAGSGGGRALRVTWAANQSGNSVSGPATLVTSPAVTDITFSGTLAGSLTGNRLSLTYMGVPGGVPGSPSCSVSGTGSATTSGSSAISGILDVSFVSCDALGLQPPANDQLTLTRQ
jgi:hypothetical protein